MKPSILSLIRLSSIILSMLMSILLMLDDYEYITLKLPYYVYFSVWILASLFLLYSLLYQRSSIPSGFIRFSIYVVVISTSIYLILNYILPKLLDNSFMGFISDTLAFTVLLFGFILFLSCIDRLEIILIGLTSAIPTGYAISRLGITEGDAVVFISFLLSSVCFIVLMFRILISKSDNKTRKSIFAVSFGAIALLDILMLLKSLSSRPAFSNTTDTFCVSVFLLACLFLFMTLPFSNYIEWLLVHKTMFKRLILFPLLVFMLILSMKFILPENTYRKMFYREFSDRNAVYFNMKNYKVDLTNSK